jgi:hypothetical protein
LTDGCGGRRVWRGGGGGGVEDFTICLSEFKLEKLLGKSRRKKEIQGKKWREVIVLENIIGWHDQYRLSRTGRIMYAKAIKRT